MIQKLLAWLRPAGEPAPAGWQGAPAQPRLKTYTAESGYVYHYYFKGWRDADEGRLYRFDYSANRKTWARIDIFLTAPGAGLPDNVRYGVAKMALFGAFDESQEPQALTPRIEVDAAGQRASLGKLGVE